MNKLQKDWDREYLTGEFMSDGMFGFEPEEAKALGSEGRYEKRVEKFKAKGLSFPRQRHYFWWIIHNLAAHGLLAVCPCRATFRFHDWTSIRLNPGIANLEDYKRQVMDKPILRTFPRSR